MRILVCDDDAAVLVLLGVALDDVELVEACREHEALGLVARGRIDAAIVDRRLPDGDGLEVVRALRREPRTADVPIVVLSAGFDPVDVEGVLAAGADEFLAKPFEPDAVADLLRRLALLSERERIVRRTVRRARAKSGNPPGGWDDLPALGRGSGGAEARKGRLAGRRARR